MATFEHPYRTRTNHRRTGGAVDETIDMFPRRGVISPPRIHRVHRRLFGIGPVHVLAALGVALLVVALVLTAAGSWIVGLFFLWLSMAVIPLFRVAVRREPGAVGIRAAVRTRGQVRRVVRGADHTGSVRGRAQARWLTRLSAISVGVWSRASRGLSRTAHRDRSLAVDAPEPRQPAAEPDRDAGEVVSTARARREQQRSARRLDVPA